MLDLLGLLALASLPWMLLAIIMTYLDKKAKGVDYED